MSASGFLGVMKTLNLSAMLAAGFTLEDYLDGDSFDREVLLLLFPGPEVTITYIANDSDLTLPS